MKTRQISCFAFLAAAFFASQKTMAAQVAANVPRYEVIDLGTLGGNESQAWGINEQGEVVGSSETGDGSVHAFRYSKGTMRDLGTLGGRTSIARGINNRGQVVGYSETQSGNTHAFLYDGVMQDLGTLRGGNSFAYGINSQGQVVGGSTITKEGRPVYREGAGYVFRAFLYSNGAMRDLGTLAGRDETLAVAYGINDRGQVVGYSEIPLDTSIGVAGYHAFLYSDGSMRDLGTLRGNFGWQSNVKIKSSYEKRSVAYGINEQGEVVGYSVVAATDPGGSFLTPERSYHSDHAFIYQGYGMRDLNEGDPYRDGSAFYPVTDYAFGINSSAHVVGGDRGGATIYLNRGGEYLSDHIDKALGWQLGVARAINNAGQIVGWGKSPSGKIHAFLLTPTPLGWRQVIEARPPQPTYSTLPKKEIAKDNLVVVTHGWQPAWRPVDVLWVDTMTNAISDYLVNQRLDAWQVLAYKWVDRARPTPYFTVVGAEIALRNAKGEGVRLGREIASNGFRHVHLIAHSAGAGLIQAASETIKTLRPDIVIHLTFLDPFVGLYYEETGNYGKGADWADAYFSQDFETSRGIFPFTEAALKYGYNVNVTWLDKSQRQVQVKASTSSGDMSQTCYEIVSSHGWPYQFYANTISPNTMFGAEGLGFPLSKEGGNWNSATNQYKVGRKALHILGNSEPSCVPNASPNALNMGLPQDFSKLPNASVFINSPDRVIIRGFDFRLNTGSPAWLAAVMPITNKVNRVSFGSQFTSAVGAEGLLTVYWETNVIGSIDERVTPLGTRQYTFAIPETATNETRTLGFRLDAFSAIQSSATVTNIALGVAGPRESFSLSFIGGNVNEGPLLKLTGPSGFNYRVETSTNLVDWTTAAILVNTNGTVRFAEPSTNKTTVRFYRAISL